MTADDIRWLYAAYKKGAFGNEFGDDLDSETFPAAFYERIPDGAGVWVLFAPTIRDDAPVGVAIGLRGHWEHHVWPHVVWFPWASARNKLEATVLFLNVQRREYKMIIAPTFEDKDFFVRVCRYGVLRRVGTSYNWSSEDAVLFETRNPS